MPEEFQVQFRTTADLSGTQSLVQGVEQATVAVKDFGSQFDAAFESIQVGLLSRVLKPEDKAAMTAALAELKTELGDTFNNSSVGEFAVKMEALKDRVLEMAHAGGTWNPSEDFERAGGSIDRTAGKVHNIDQHLKDAAQGGMQLVGALSAGEAPGSALVNTLRGLGGIGGGVIGGGIAVGLTALVSGIVAAKEKAEQFKLDQLKAEVASADAAFKRLGDSMRENFGASLAEQKAKLQEFLNSWKEVMQSTGAGYARQQREADSETKSTKAARSVQDQQLIANTAPEDVAAVTRDLDESARQEALAAKYDGLTREMEKADQEVETTKAGVEHAKQSARDAQRQIDEGEAMKIEGRKVMTGAGVMSDQDRTIFAWNDITRREGRGELSEEEKKKRESLRTRIDDARAQRDSGDLTYEDAANDKNLSPEQQRALRVGGAMRDNGDAAIAAGKEALGAAQKEGAAAANAAADARSNQGIARDNSINAYLEDAAADFARDNKAEQAASGASNGAAVAAEARNGGAEAAGQVEQLGAAVNEGFSAIKDALSAVIGKISSIESQISSVASQVDDVEGESGDGAEASKFQQRYNAKK